MERKNYIDNIRWMTVLLVLVYHVIYIFNNSGVISNFDVKGIPQLDAILIFVYPWFMSLLFVVAGVSARYALQNRSGKEFIKSRAKRILLPSVTGIFIIGWFAGLITDYYVDMFGANRDVIPGVIKYLIYCMSGIGPLWFAHQLFLASLVLLLIRKIDKKKKLEQLGNKCGIVAIFVMVIPYWLSSMILNTPLIEVYRNGFYIFSFLLGYYVFSEEKVLEKLAKIRWALLGIAVVTGVIYTVVHYGKNYTMQDVLQHVFTNAYAWLVILTVFSWAKKCLNFKNGFSTYMTKANFGFYVLHYPLLCAVAFVTQLYLPLPIGFHYIVNLVLVLLLVPIVYEVLRRIPVLRLLVLGISKEKK